MLSASLRISMGGRVPLCNYVNFHAHANITKLQCSSTELHSQSYTVRTYSGIAAEMSFLTFASACKDALLMAVSFLALSILFMIGNILKLLPYSTYFIPKLFLLIAGVYLPTEMFWNSLLGAEMMKALWRMCCLNIKAKLREGKPFPDAQLVDTKTIQR